MKQQIKTLIKQAITKLYPEYSEIDFTVDFAPANIDADYASNIAMVLVKKVGKKPMEVAEEIRDSIGPRLRSGLQNDICVEVAAPGFLNFKLSKEFLLENLQKIDEHYGSSDLGQSRLAIVEYFQLNVAKAPHVGHLRSAVIGDALKRILNFVGYKAVSDTHIGDWGTQFGILLWAVKNHTSGKISDVDELNRLYVTANKKIDKDENIREQAKAEFVKLEKGDKENKKLWKNFVALSHEEFDRSAKMLGLLPFDYDLGESFYQDKMSQILKKLEEKDLLVTGKTGEKYIDLEKYGLGRLICVKSDGGTTYELRDLATVAYRYDEIAARPLDKLGDARNDNESNLAWNLYVVDSRQAHDFRQVFKTMELLGYDMSKSVHIEFGFMSLPEGAMSTRKGNIISLELLIAEAKKRALKIIKEKNPKLKDKARVAEQVALAAIKYGDLKHNRKSDIIFDWDEAMSFEGNTGPYLQYTYARLKSILRKSKNVIARSETTKQSHGSEIAAHPADARNDNEMTLLRKLTSFPDIIQDTAAEFLPSILASYLYELAQEVNSFYHEVPVLQEEDEEKKNFRLTLVTGAAQVLNNGLNLLGIEAVDEM